MSSSDSEDSEKPTALSKSKTSRRRRSLESDSSDENKKFGTSKSRSTDKKSTTKSWSVKSSTKKELTSDDDDLEFSVDHEKEIKKLKKELRKSKLINIKLTNKCEELEETIVDYKTKFNKEKIMLEIAIDKKSDEVDELRKDLIKERKKEKKSPHNSTKPEEIEKLKAEHKEEIDRLEKEIEETKEEYEYYESKYRNLALENEELVKQVDALKEECEKSHFGQSLNIIYKIIW